MTNHAAHAAILCTIAATSAHAGITVNITEVGDDVIVSASGTLDLSTWEDLGAIGGDLSPVISVGVVFLGPEVFNVDFYAPPADITGPSQITADVTGPTSSVGDSLGFEFFGRGLYLPDGYTSGDALASTDTYANQTYASMGLVEGETYLWTWQTATEGEDFFRINIPAPGTATAAMLACAASTRRRR